MAFQGSLVAGIESALLSDTKDFGDAINSFSFSARQKITTGTGVNQADLFYAKKHTLAASGTLAIDLNGSSNDGLNRNIAMTSIVGILVFNRDPDTGANSVGTLTLGGGSNPITGLVANGSGQRKVNPGEMFYNFCGEAGGLCTVTAGTGDILNITNSAAGSSTFSVFVIGRSA